MQSQCCAMGKLSATFLKRFLFCTIYLYEEVDLSYAEWRWNGAIQRSTTWQCRDSLHPLLQREKERSYETIRNNLAIYFYGTVSFHMRQKFCTLNLHNPTPSMKLSENKMRENFRKYGILLAYTFGLFFVPAYFDLFTMSWYFVFGDRYSMKIGWLYHG